MTSSNRIFTMNDLKLPNIIDDLESGYYFHCSDLIKASQAYLETMTRSMSNLSILEGQNKSKKFVVADATRSMTNSLKEYNKLTYERQLLVLTCLARNLPMTLPTVSESTNGAPDILTIETGLEITTFVYTFGTLVETMVKESESCPEVKTDGSFVFALRLNFKNQIPAYSTFYIHISGSEAENIIKQSSSGVLLPNGAGFKLSEDTAIIIKHYSLNSNFIKVEEKLKNDLGLRLELKTEGSGENEVDVCLLINMNSFPIRTENLDNIVLLTTIEELKGSKMTEKPKQDNKTWQQVADEHVAKPVHSAQEIDHAVGNAVMWKFTDIFAAVKFAVSSMETSPNSHVLIDKLCEYLENKPGFVNLLKTYIQNVEKYNWVIVNRGMNSFLDVLEYNSKHGTDYDYVPNPGSLMEPRYGWKNIDPVSGAVSFCDDSRHVGKPAVLTEEIKDTVVTKPKFANGELTELYAKINALESGIQARFAEMTKIYSERAMFHGNGMFSIFKVAKLPKDFVPNSMYLVGEPDSDKFDLYITGVNGELRALNIDKDEKEITRAVCKTLEISDPKAVKAWIGQTQAVAANIEIYYKHCGGDPETRTPVDTEETSIREKLEHTKTTLDRLIAKQDRIYRNSISGAMSGKINNAETQSKEPDTGMELTGWRELSALAKHLNIDLSDIYVFLTSDGKVEIREHVMFPSKETLDQIDKPPYSFSQHTSN